MKKHWHHIIPKHSGGDNSPSNLIELTIEEHSAAHLALYEKTGNYKDLLASKLILASVRPNFRENACKLAREAAKLKAVALGLKSTYYLRSPEKWGVLTENQRNAIRMNGERQGKINRENGHMSKLGKSTSPEKRRENGIKGANTNKMNFSGSFYDPVLQKIAAAKGGRSQGKVNAVSGHCEKISLKYWEDVASGKVVRTPKKWYFNPETNHSILVVLGNPIPTGYVPGRRQTKKG